MENMNNEAEILSTIELKVVDSDLLSDSGKTLLKTKTIIELKRLIKDVDINRMTHEQAYQIGHAFMQWCDILLGEHLEKTYDEE